MNEYTEAVKTWEKIDKVKQHFYVRFQDKPTLANRAKYYRWLHLETVAFKTVQAFWRDYVS